MQTDKYKSYVLCVIDTVEMTLHLLFMLKRVNTISLMTTRLWKQYSYLQWSITYFETFQTYKAHWHKRPQTPPASKSSTWIQTTSLLSSTANNVSLCCLVGNKHWLNQNHERIRSSAKGLDDARECVFVYNEQQDKIHKSYTFSIYTSAHTASLDCCLSYFVTVRLLLTFLLLLLLLLHEVLTNKQNKSAYTTILSVCDYRSYLNSNFCK